MEKIIPADSWPNLDVNPLEQIKIASDGLRGNDKHGFLTKRAGSNVFANYLSRVKLASGDIPLHLIALSATEFTGPNRNSDGFSKKACENYHDTFVKHARLYENHCFTADTPILKADRTRVPIQQIKVGDKVATQFGVETVLKTYCREYIGTGVKLSVSGTGRNLVTTDNHMMLALRRSQVHCRHSYNRLGSAPHGLVCKEWREGLDNIKPQFVRADTLAKGDYLLIPAPKHGKQKVDLNFAELVGWVASEGYLGARGRGTIQFTFSTKNTADIAAVTACLERNNLYVGRHDVEDTCCTMLSACSKLLHAELSKYVVGVKAKKRLTAKVLKWNAAALYALLTAYIDGDGSVSTKKHNKGLLRIRSSSPNMLGILSDVIRALGIPATVHWDGKAGAMKSSVGGKLYQGNGSGVVNVRGPFINTITKHTRKHVNYTGIKSTNLLSNGLQLVRIRDVKTVELNEPVYNLEITGAHQYVANEVIVHNCNKDPKRSFGYVKLSAYNQRMGRVELLVIGNGTKQAAERNGGLVLSDNIRNNLEKQAALGCSMSCRILHDVCSNCFNKAANRSEYCTEDTCFNPNTNRHGFGCKYGLAKLASDGFMQYVDNPEPDFFDISIVGRPADRTAYGSVADYLTKAASANRVIGGAELAELFSRENYPNGKYANDNSMSKMNMAVKLATYENQAISTNAMTMAAGVKSASHLAAPPLGYDTHQLLQALANVKIAVSVDDFFRYCGVPDSDKHAEKVADYLPSLFATYVKEPSNGSWLAVGAIAPRLQKWAYEHMPMHSLDDYSVQQRVWLSVLQDKPLVKKASSNKRDKNYMKLASAYADYLLDCLSLWNDDKYGEMLVLRNKVN